MSNDIKPNSDVGFYTKKLDNHIQRYMHSLYNRKELEECSLTNMWVIDYLFDQGDNDVFQKDIETEFFINKATASKMLSLMEEKKFIKRATLKTDARLKKITLAPKGKSLHGVCMSMRKEIERKLTQGFTDEEKEVFKNFCKRILKNMEE